MESVVVTGHSGFIGRNLVIGLENAGFNVIKQGRKYWPVECDRIYHLACPSTTDIIHACPTGIMDIIMDATRSALTISPTAMFINASTKGAADIYLDKSPQGCYNVAKRCMENYVSFNRSNSISYRIPSVYGPGMHNNNFIKLCIDGRAHEPAEPSKKHYIAHIDDVVEALINLTPITTEEITLGEIYESFGSRGRGLHRPALGSQVIE